MKENKYWKTCYTAYEKPSVSFPLEVTNLYLAVNSYHLSQPIFFTISIFYFLSISHTLVFTANFPNFFLILPFIQFEGYLYIVLFKWFDYRF
jgi:hypothetical protein